MSFIRAANGSFDPQNIEDSFSIFLENFFTNDTPLTIQGASIQQSKLTILGCSLS